MTQWVDFREVKARVAIRDILDDYGVQYREMPNGRLVATCPVHQGDNPRAFHADVEKNCWKCFTGCRSGGNILDLVMAIEQVSVREAALMLQERFMKPENRPRKRRTARSGTGRRPSPTTPPSRPRRASATPKPSTTNRASRRPSRRSPQAGNPPLELTLNLRAQHPYLEQRGVSPQAIAEFGLGYCPRGILAGRIAIPIHNANGQLVAYAGRHPKGKAPKYKFPAGFAKSRELFNLHRAAPHAGKHGLVLVEGFFDAINLWQLGVPNAVALMGTELSDDQLALLQRSTDRITLMLDGDEAGREAAAAMVPRLAERVFVRAERLPEEVQPDSLTTIPPGWYLT